MVACHTTTIIESVLIATPCPDNAGTCGLQTVFDREQQHYMVVVAGWHGSHRIHQCLVHIAYHNERIWIHCDHTSYGIPTRLIAAGIPAIQILRVLPMVGMRMP